MLKISIEFCLNSKYFMYSSNRVVYGLSKPNIELETSSLLILIIYIDVIITQTMQGYWSNINELNFPFRKPKSIMT